MPVERDATPVDEVKEHGRHESLHHSRRPEPDSVREQLKRLLANRRFVQSPRCQSLLRFIVEESLAGNSDSLKERIIGVEVFKRAATYDTNADPVVRVAVSEIRKKLALYYYEPENRSQVRIELPSGSYIPEFFLPELPQPQDDPDALRTAIAVETTAEIAAKPHPRKGMIAVGLLAGLAVLLCALGLVVWRMEFSKTAFEKFWAPLYSTHQPVLVCIGEMTATRLEVKTNPSRSASTAVAPVSGVEQAGVHLSVSALDDVIALSDVTGRLRADGESFDIHGETEVTYEDLQKGPSVLIGAFNNDWTMYLTRSMRFTFNLDPGGQIWWIGDKKDPSVKYGLFETGSAVPRPHEYAVVARLINPETKQPVVIAAGITPPGTRTAGKFISSPQYMAEFQKTAPAGWQNKNIELLLMVDLVDGRPGPPRVVGSSIW